MADEKASRSVAVRYKAACCGCMACAAVCPKAAIASERDFQGFDYPTVDVGLCVGCGLCAAVCPFERAEGARA